jgi:two-component system, OmpR family, sensor histidine kinase KdpD
MAGPSPARPGAKSLRVLYADSSAGLRDNTKMQKAENRGRRDANWIGYATAAAAALGCTLAGLAMQARFDIVNIAMVYLLAVVGVALYASRGAAVFSAALSVITFDIVFVPPAGMLTVDDLQYLLTFAIMLVVALAISSLRLRARDEEARRITMAVEADRERTRSTLLASISHDLRTPLAVMAGASSSLAEQGEQMSAAERSALARSIYDQTTGMTGQVDKVLQMTRLELGGLALQRDWASIAEIAGAVLGRLQSRLEHHRVTVDIPDTLPLVRVDAPLIALVFSNLLDNAALHTPPDTTVHVHARQSGTEIEVCVDDFGPGLDEQTIGQLFDKFHQRRQEGADAGIGLGLAICRAIIVLHGGRIQAEPLPGGGARFRFYLPVEAAPLPPEEPAGNNRLP